MKPYVWQARVYYEDTDSGGVVYYANYLNYMERARTEWLRSLGVEQDKLLDDYNILFAVRSVNIEYKKPARFNDMLNITVEPSKLKPASISFKQIVSRQNEERSLLSSSQVNVVCLGVEDFMPKPIPKTLLEEIKGAC